MLSVFYIMITQSYYIKVSGIIFLGTGHTNVARIYDIWRER